MEWKGMEGTNYSSFWNILPRALHVDQLMRPCATSKSLSLPTRWSFAWTVTGAYLFLWYQHIMGALLA
ncbi:hypothetical protein P691DRAFT_769695 [Macrolepiota fuliginosa MF-IS2]|uniref:Uncharacterized protein n=1 Tax=Macrolepiota fuliginosa MF-IS2 TaxID=1400762 RepID=A0A9P6BUB1_9AGAR|nr:hypothetical protein P691DRAFT_769695 [Macrolepiota fuliginosa MF-IS2]